VGGVRWRVEATVEAADTTTVTLALTWQRSVVEGATGSRGVATGDTRVVRLRASDVHVLDLIQADPGSPSACANVLIRVRAARVEPAVRRPRWLTYNLWLTYESANGEPATRHLELAGVDEAPVAVEFVPVRWGLNHALAGPSSQAAVVLTVRGTVRGHCRLDGAVDVALDTVRTVLVGETGGAGEGRKEFRLAPSDTIAVEIPNPTATLSAPWTAVARSPQPWAPGVQGSADTVTVDLGEFFRGSRVWVLVGGRCH